MSWIFGAAVLAGGYLAARQLHRVAPDDLHDVFDDDLVLGGRLTIALHDEAEHLAAEPTITCIPPEAPASQTEGDKP